MAWNSLRRCACAGALAWVGCRDDSDARAPTWSESSGEGADDIATGDDAHSSSGAADDDSDDAAVDSTGADEPDPGDPWQPAPELPPLPDDAVAQLQLTIDSILNDPVVAGASQSVYVLDGEIGQELYARNAEVVLEPASNTKLLTTAAAFDRLGPDHRVETTLWAPALPDGAGTIAGDLHMLGHHDPSWSGFTYSGARVPLDRIAAGLGDAGVTSVAGTIWAIGEFLYEGDNFSYYDAATHRDRAVARLGDALAAVGIASGAGNTAAQFEPPVGAVELLRWSSPPLSVTSVPLNVESHNEYADILGRHLAFELTGQSDAGVGGTEVIAFLDSIGTDVTGVALYDGSGLSHDNRVSAHTIVDLLEFALGESWGLPWVRTFSIAGVRGTLGSRMTGADTWGRVWGKTGSLTGVIATSGIAFSKYDGRRYLVSILMNDTGDSSGVRAIHDAVFGAVASDLRVLGPRPAAPVLQTVRTAVGKDVVELAWDPVADATGYLVWLSPDGRHFARSDARLVDGPMYRAGTLPSWPTVFVRVSAIAVDVEGEASDVYGATVDDLGDRVLVVDGNDRWQAQPQPENPLGIGHDFAVDHVAAIADIGVDCASNEAVESGDIALSDYRAVIWMLGEESETDVALSPEEQQLIASFLDAGGALMISGAELGYDLVELGTVDDAMFFGDVLHAVYVGDDADTQIAASSDPALGIPTLQFHTPATAVADYPDRLAPGAGAQPWLVYRGGTGDGAAVHFTGDHAVLVLGFPFEAIDHPDDRTAVMTAALQALQ